MIIKNTTGGSKTYYGQLIPANTNHTVDESQRAGFAKDTFLIADIMSGDAVINDGVNDLQPILGLYLLQDFQDRDTDGRTAVRPAAARKGAALSHHSIEFKTAKLGSVVETDEDGADMGLSSLKLYKFTTQWDEITDPANEGDTTRTVLTFAPTFDYEIYAAEIRSFAAVTTDCRVWAKALPDVPANSKYFLSGGLNMKFMNSKEVAEIEGVAAKYMPYQYTGLPDGWANKIALILDHAVGVQHEFMMSLRIFT